MVYSRPDTGEGRSRSEPSQLITACSDGCEIDHPAISPITQALIQIVVDRLLQEVHRSVAEYELGAVGMLRLEALGSRPVIKTINGRGWHIRPSKHNVVE